MRKLPAVPAFDPAAARRALPRFDMAVRAQPTGVLADYERLFGLDALAALPGVRHHYGALEAWGYQIAVHVFLPPRPRGTLLVLHGYFDHVGLFTHPIRRGLERGYAVVAYDLPGHGLSSGAAGDIDDFQHYQEVLRDVVSALKPELPEPWVAVGQSTGGGILLDHVLSSLAAGQRPLFRRVQLWAPLVRIAQWRKVLLGHALMAKFRSSFPRHFRRSSSDERFIDLLWHHDPMQSDHIPVRWLSSMIRWERHLQALPGCRFPVTVVQGDRDETVDWRYNVDFVARKTFVEKRVDIHGAAHHLANERADWREQVLAALERYLLT